MSSPNNILVIRLSSLGDVLMSMPAVKAIRDAHPHAHITWLVEGSVGDLLSHQTFIDEVVQFPRSRIARALKRGNAMGVLAETGPFLRELKRLDYDVIVDFHGIIKSAILAHCARGARRIGFGRMFAKEKSHLFYDDRVESTDRRIHKVERNMLLARRVGAHGPVPKVSLTVCQDVSAYIDGFFQREGITSPVFAVNPFSSKGSRFKRWDMERYGELIRRLRSELGVKVLILWGPGEEKEADALKGLTGNGVFLSCPTNVPQLFALLKRVDMYIGGDTGVMHLACFARTPLVTIFGPTDWRINGPHDLPRSLIRRNVECSPCKKKDCRDRRCLTEITVDEVFEAVSRTYRGTT
jgi:heptosyltransferase-1